MEWIGWDRGIENAKRRQNVPGHFWDPKVAGGYETQDYGAAWRYLRRLVIYHELPRVPVSLHSANTFTMVKTHVPPLWGHVCPGCASGT